MHCWRPRLSPCSPLFGELLDRVTGPIDRLLARGRAAGVVRRDIAATYFAPILEMLCALTGLDAPGVPYLPHRYIGLILAGLRPGAGPLPGEPPTLDKLRRIATAAASPAGRS